MTSSATAPLTAPEPAPGTGDEPTAALDALDDALVALRRAQQQPGYRRAVLAGIDADVELATVRLLRAVQRAGGSPTIGTVAEILVIDASTASRLVERAVQDGWLERRPCADDRRRVRLELTDAGGSLLEQLTRQRRRIIAGATADIPEAQLLHLVELLEVLAQRLGDVERRT